MHVSFVREAHSNLETRHVTWVTTVAVNVGNPSGLEPPIKLVCEVYVCELRIQVPAKAVEYVPPVGAIGRNRGG